MKTKTKQVSLSNIHILTLTRAATRHQASMFKPPNQKSRQHEICAQIKSPGSVWCHREYKGGQLEVLGYYWIGDYAQGLGIVSDLFGTVSISTCLSSGSPQDWSRFLQIWMPWETAQVGALCSWWPANLVTLTQAINLCVTSPHTAPIPLLILPLPSVRINAAATARETGRWTFIPLSPEDQCWIGFMGFMICPFSSRQGCGELGVTSGPWQSHRRFWAVRVTLSLNKEQHWAFLRWLRPLWTRALVAGAPRCTTTICKGQTLPGAHSWHWIQSNPCTHRGESAGKWHLVSDPLMGFQRL